MIDRIEECGLFFVCFVTVNMDVWCQPLFYCFSFPGGKIEWKHKNYKHSANENNRLSGTLLSVIQSSELEKDGDNNGGLLIIGA